MQGGGRRSDRWWWVDVVVVSGGVDMGVVSEGERFRGSGQLWGGGGGFMWEWERGCH